MIVLTACQPEAPPEVKAIRPVKTIVLHDQVDFQQVWLSGRAAATQQVDLSFRVAGSLIERPVNVGDRVSQGQMLARLNPDIFQAEVAGLRAQVNQAQAERDRAAADLERNRQLANRGHISQAALDAFVSEANVTAATVDAQLATLRSAELRLSYTEILAPFDGEVVRIFVENFQDVQINQPILRLVDSSRIEMTLNVPESLISLVNGVEEIEVYFDPFPDVQLFAEIKEIGTEASDVTRTYPVTLIMDQPETVTILPGMAGRAASREDPRPPEARGSVVVPETALFADNGGQESFVWVVNEASQTVSKRQVDVFELTSNGYTITDGLVPGERIVVAGVNYLEDGQSVRLLD